MSLIHITKDNFEAEVLRTDKVVLLDFYADWCGPCKMIAPYLEEIAAERSDITVAKVNVDHNMELAMEYKVASIPLLLVMKDGKILKKSLGAMPKEEILALLP